jgi:hypothetical protein
MRLSSEYRPILFLTRAANGLLKSGMDPRIAVLHPPVIRQPLPGTSSPSYCTEISCVHIARNAMLVVDVLMDAEWLWLYRRAVHIVNVLHGVVLGLQTYKCDNYGTLSMFAYS